VEGLGMSGVRETALGKELKSVDDFKWVTCSRQRLEGKFKLSVMYQPFHEY
jgi:hypothetical protein